MKLLIEDQIAQAFSSQPGRDGVIHGIRRIKQGKHGSRSSLFFSAKNKALIPVESRLERAYCYCLEADPGVQQYRVQALSVPFRGHFLYPDFLILTSGNTPQVREVKALRFLNTSKNSAKLAHLDAVFSALGIAFGPITEEDLWTGHECRNRIMLYDRGGKLAPSPDSIAAAVRIVGSLSGSCGTISEIRKLIGEASLPSYLLEAAIFNGKLCCDIRHPIHAKTRIEVAK